MPFSAPEASSQTAASAIRRSRVRIATCPIVSSGQNKSSRSASPTPSAEAATTTKRFSGGPYLRPAPDTHLLFDPCPNPIATTRSSEAYRSNHCRDPPGIGWVICSDWNLSRAQKKSHYLRNPLPNMLLGRIPRVCQHRPKRTLCRFRTTVRNIARNTAVRNNVRSNARSNAQSKVRSTQNRSCTL